ncbi:olfactory receptor 5M5-like [Mantella aurantiaca]
MCLNDTTSYYFILKGISDVPELQVLIVLLVLLIYLITLGGNMTIFFLVCIDSHLHTPMYFFLANLSILDICSSTTTLHRVIINFILEDKTISFIGCLTQIIRTSIGRRKTFYTCSSHLTVVIFLYITLICQYLKPVSMTNMNSNKLFSLFNTAAIPMLNPLIYSLKNKDVKAALKRNFGMCCNCFIQFK